MTLLLCGSQYLCKGPHHKAERTLAAHFVLFFIRGLSALHSVGPSAASGSLAFKRAVPMSLTFQGHRCHRSCVHCCSASFYGLRKSRTLNTVFKSWQQAQAQAARIKYFTPCRHVFFNVKYILTFFLPPNI